MFMVWYVPGAVAANWKTLSRAASESTRSVTVALWLAGSRTSTV
jgi:hypothetical protein